MKALPRSLLPFFWHFLKRHAGQIFLMQILFLAWSLDLALWPVIIGKLLDGMKEISSQRDLLWSSLHPLILFALLLWLTTQTAFRLGGLIWAKILPEIESEMRMEMFEYAQGHSHKFFGEHLSGSIAHNINSMVISFVGILELVMMAFLPTLGMYLISTALFIAVSPLFGFILLAWIIAHMAVCIWTAPRCCIAAESLGAARAGLQGAIVDSLSNYVSVKLFAKQAQEQKYIEQCQTTEVKAYQHSEMESVKVCVILGILSFVGAGIGVHGFILYAWKEGWATPGEVIFGINTAWSAVMMAWWVGTSIPWLYSLWGICKQSLTFVQVPHEITDKPDAKNLVVTRGEITFEGVSFGYREKQLFQNKTLTIHHGQKIGLVGYSGAGKTTFIQLILRFYNLDKGKIYIDGQDIASVTLTSLRKQVAVIPQDPQLFSRSILDNIRYGRIEAEEKEIIHASKLAHCHEFIMELPKGYLTVIGESGIKLSGGQRQRLAIARAFLANAPILVLDEATSALDSSTEKEIQESLKILMQGRTTIVIAHRLSTLRGLDRILVFENGKIVEEGSHAALIAYDGVYARMWKIQAGGMLPESESEEAENQLKEII